MAVIIDEFKVVIAEPPATAGPPQLPPPPTPTSDLRPQDVRDVIAREMERSLRVYAH